MEFQEQLIALLQTTILGVLNIGAGYLVYYIKQIADKAKIKNQENENEKQKILIDNAIESLQQHIFRTKVFIKYIDKIIKKLEKDEYYPIIKLKYFKGKSIEEIAEILKKDSSTISRNKNRLINELKPLLLPNEVISNIFNY